MLRRDALKWLGCALPAAYFGQMPVRADVAPGKAATPTSSALRTIEIEIDRETEEAAVASSVVISPNGQIVAAGCDDHRIRLWNIADGSTIAQLRSHNDWVRGVAFHPQGKKLVSVGDDYAVLLWDLETNAVVHRHDVATGVLHAVAFRPDGKIFATAGFDDQVRIFDVATGKITQQLTVPAADVKALAFSPNNQQLAAAGRNGVIRVWDLTGFKQLRDIPAHRMRVRSIAYSPDSSQMASVGDDRKFYLWNADGTRAATLPTPAGRLFSLTFLGPDFLASGGSDNLIRVLDLRSRRELAQLSGHTGSVAGLDYHAESNLIASAGFDTTVRIWKPALTESSPAKITQRPTFAPPQTFSK
ncbi:MAG: WD40 repeat domain-containing protein [Planctomycetia bacterium]|nr:WD40 repeat domain-containing protein [Planctomycetia bacterium]